MAILPFVFIGGAFLVKKYGTRIGECVVFHGINDAVVTSEGGWDGGANIHQLLNNDPLKVIVFGDQH